MYGNRIDSNHTVSSLSGCQECVSACGRCRNGDGSELTQELGPGVDAASGESSESGSEEEPDRELHWRLTGRRSVQAYV